MKTSELTGAALDWAVARLESKASPSGMDSAGILLYRSTATNAFMYKRWAIPYSTDWTQGGPIIDREKIDLFTEKGAAESWVASVARYQNGARLVGWRIHQYGPTPLIAAMRCYVASKMGAEIEVPKELTI